MIVVLYIVSGLFAYPLLWCSIIEIQTFMIQVVRNFKLTYPKDAAPVFRAVSGVMAPVLYEELGKGKQLPLEITTLESS